VTKNPIYLAAALAALAIGGCAQNAPQDDAAASALQAVETVYAGFAAGDIALATSTMAADIDWREAKGNPYADKNPYIGPDAVVSGLFARLGGEWDGFTATPEEFVTQGGRVIVFGQYSGTYLATGKALDAPFVHSWTVEDGKVVKFVQFTDTAGQVAVMAGAGD
jgi:ketosteroid isomerase-like protein